MENQNSLKVNERKVLQLLMENKDYSFREIAKLVNLNEVSVRRLHNKLKQDNVFYTLNIPNFSSLGYNIMMVQRIDISSPYVIEIRNIIKNMMGDWKNCTDCHETYDGKVIIRSIWRNAEEFKKAHAEFYKKHGTAWLAHEQIDMIPLDNSTRLLRVSDVAF